MTQFDIQEEDGVEVENTGPYGEDDVEGSEEVTFVPAEEVDVDVDSSDTEDDEVEEVASGGEAKEEKPKKEKAQPKRGDLPEGYITPVGLAKEITKRGLYFPKDSDTPGELKPQMVYSYAKNSPKDNPFPEETVEDSLGNQRKVVQIEKGVEWWVTKNARAEERRTNAAKKAQEKAAKAEKAAAADVEETEDDDNQEPAVEAE